MNISPIFHLQNPLHLACLRQLDQKSFVVNHILGQFAGLEFNICLMDIENFPLYKLFEQDLILIEYVQDHTVTECVEHILTLRDGAFPPIAVLTDIYTTDFIVDTLKSGADDIIAFDTPMQVVIDRCYALIRRWRTQSQSVQRRTMQ